MTMPDPSLETVLTFNLSLGYRKATGVQFDLWAGAGRQ